jgi:hypothetical protein
MEQKEILEKASQKETIRIRISGDKVQKGKISTRTLVSILEGFTQFADSIANAVLNAPTDRGRIPQEVEESVDFQVVGTFAGSFGIILEKPTDIFALLPIETKTSAVLGEMFSVFESNSDDESLLDAIIPNGNRAIRSYQAWLEDLASKDVDLELSWLSSTAEQRKVKINAKSSNDVVAVLKSIDENDDTEVLHSGILTGVNIRNHRFEMTVEGLGIIKGTAKFETLISISEMMGKEIIAKLIRSTTYSKARVAKITWYLMSAEMQNK